MKVSLAQRDTSTMRFAATSSAPGGAQQIDPIFAAIERHRTAREALGIAAIAADEVAAELEGRTVSQAELDAVDAANDAFADAIADLIATTPATLAGIQALLTEVSGSDGVDFDAREIAASLLLSPPLCAAA